MRQCRTEKTREQFTPEPACPEVERQPAEGVYPRGDIRVAGGLRARGARGAGGGDRAHDHVRSHEAEGPVGLIPALVLIKHRQSPQSCSWSNQSLRRPS